MRVYAIFDSKGSFFHTPPIFERNNASAVRAFANAAQTEGHQFNRFAGDYTLFCIAEWDELSGTIVPLEAKENLGTALQYQQTEPTNELGQVARIR